MGGWYNRTVILGRLRVVNGPCMHYDIEMMVLLVLVRFPNVHLSQLSTQETYIFHNFPLHISSSVDLKEYSFDISLEH